MEQVFKFTLCAAIFVVCGLQLLQNVGAKPLPGADLDDVDFNATSTNLVKCQCNETNLTMMVDGHFLCRWRIGRHGISRLTAAAAPGTFAGLQVRGYLYTFRILASYTYSIF